MRNCENLPNGWECGIGESSEPLSENGYYVYPYYYRLPGSNQHEEKFLELVVDTVGVTPQSHEVRLAEMVEDDTEIREIRLIAADSFKVSNQNHERSQVETAEKALERAQELMQKYPKE